MSRAKATFKTVDLTRAINAARSAGLTITMTRIEPDGSIVLSHSDPNVTDRASDPDDALAQWQSKRRTS